MSGRPPAPRLPEPPTADGWDRRRPGRARWLGRLGYDEALALQQTLHARRAAGREPDTLLLLEHESVYTHGRRTDPGHFLVAPETLEARGHAVRETTRGGDVTWHGPGQLVAYPILDLSDGRRDVRRYLAALEDVLVATARSLGVPAWRREGMTGAWTDGGKIGAVGVRLARWVTLHGTSFNVAPDLSHVEAIVPCGLEDRRVTSILRETGADPGLAVAARCYAQCFAERFRVDWEELDIPASDAESDHAP